MYEEMFEKMVDDFVCRTYEDDVLQVMDWINKHGYELPADYVANSLMNDLESYIEDCDTEITVFCEDERNEVDVDTSVSSAVSLKDGVLCVTEQTRASLLEDYLADYADYLQGCADDYADLKYRESIGD